MKGVSGGPHVHRVGKCAQQLPQAGVRGPCAFPGVGLLEIQTPTAVISRCVINWKHSEHRL